MLTMQLLLIQWTLTITFWWLTYHWKRLNRYVKNKPLFYRTQYIIILWRIHVTQNCNRQIVDQFTINLIELVNRVLELSYIKMSNQYMSIQGFFSSALLTSFTNEKSCCVQCGVKFTWRFIFLYLLKFFRRLTL